MTDIQKEYKEFLKLLAKDPIRKKLHNKINNYFKYPKHKNHETLKNIQETSDRP